MNGRFFARFITSSTIAVKDRIFTAANSAKFKDFLKFRLIWLTWWLLSQSNRWKYRDAGRGNAARGGIDYSF
jgi:hypothetical protein